MSDDIKKNIEALPPLRDVIAAHGLRAEKALGQNFLLDLNLTDKIARLGGALDGLDVIEIGPGPGGLTRRLVANNPRSVTALEKDSRAIIALQDVVDAAQGALSVCEEDALAIDLQLIGRDGARAIIANLPYNIATPLLINWLKDIDAKGADAYQFMALMFQKEVAQRIVARCGDKTYGRLAVLCQYLCDVKLALSLPPSAFTPPPKVTSAVVVFRPKDKGALQPDLSILERLTKDAFGQRRKMIRSSLKAYLPVIETLGIDPTSRAEELDVQQYVQLASKIQERGI